MVTLLVSSALVLAVLSPVWWGRVESMVKTGCKLLTNPKKLLPFYDKPPALVDPSDILIGMVCTELLRPDAVLLCSQNPERRSRISGVDSCRRHEKFEILWDCWRRDKINPIRNIHVVVFDVVMDITDKQRDTLKEAILKRLVFEKALDAQRAKERAQQKACDLLEKWCGVEQKDEAGFVDPN